MKAPPTAIIVLSPEVVEQEQNSSANQVKAEEYTIIVEQEQNSLKETQMSVFVAICNKSKRGEDYGILQLVISIDTSGKSIWVLLAKSTAHCNATSYRGNEFYGIEGLGKPLARRNNVLAYLYMKLKYKTL
ncbi:hypothetical protein FH972_006277 [Carpinus fangiana]|uniref:Uncharacterized protein n=1 Tax=Carpinus fangiana TaxID=176857 RepID=A0A5N6QTM6_9ROSI|nr:hypothetical protein FH972_006277 [Carpinus fangiana]